MRVEAPEQAKGEAPSESRSLVTPGEAAGLLHLTRGTVRRKLLSGDLPGLVRLGSGPKAPIRMQRAELDRLTGGGQS